MKKILMFAMALVVALSLMACGSNKNKKEDVAPPVEDKPNDQGLVEDNDMNGDLDHNGDENRIDVAEDAADQVEALDEVKRATVLVTNRNAYVAVVMNDDTENAEGTEDTDGTDEVPKALEDKIAEKVRAAASDIDNVYVSLNPDFVERMHDYGQRINEGEPIEGFFDEFGEAVRNVFPDAR